MAQGFYLGLWRTLVLRYGLGEAAEITESYSSKTLGEELGIGKEKGEHIFLHLYEELNSDDPDHVSALDVANALEMAGV